MATTAVAVELAELELAVVEAAPVEALDCVAAPAGPVLELLEVVDPQPAARVTAARTAARASGG
ncbi:MAG: hypothetical protein ACYC0H_07895 [Solirubrobacteraceae bacterium]